MGRPRKIKEEELTEEVESQAETNETDGEGEKLITLNHFIRNGSLSIDGETYEIKDSKVSVKPEHVEKAKAHIAMGS